jgi:hypothetical protein
MSTRKADTVPSKDEKTMQKAKPFDRPSMPSEPIKVTLNGEVTATLMHDFDRYSNGKMMMAVTSATVKQDGKEIGDIRGDISAPILAVSFGQRSWLISSEDLFAAVLEADRKYQAEQA